MESFTTVISPESTACGRSIKLSAIDQIAPRDYITVCMCFRMADDVDIRQQFSHLQTALYNTLNDIPQLMTTIRPCNNGREELELAYDSTRGATIRFRDYVSTEKARSHWPHGTFEELKRDHFPYAKLEKNLVLSPIDQFSDKSYPGLAMQANYIPGGVILTSRLFHTICDGTGNYLFYQTLAKYTSAACRGEKLSLGQTVSFFERTTVVDPEHAVHIDEFPNWKPVEPSDGFLKPVHYDPKQLPKVQYAIFFIPESRIQRLRSIMSTESNKPSSIEALGAFLWMKVVQARDIDADKYPEAKLSITVDTRKRMTMPVVPMNFWGNLSEPNAVARMPTRSLLYPTFADTSASASPAARAAQAVTELQGKLSEAARNAQGKWNEGVRNAQEKWQEAVHNAQDALSEAARNAQDRLNEAARNAQDKLNEVGRAAQEKFPEAARAVVQVNDAWNNNLAEASKRIKMALAAVDNTAVRRLVGLINQMPKSTSLTWNVDRWPGPDMLIVCVNYHFYNYLDFGPVLGESECMRFSVGDTEGKPDGRCLLMPPRRCDGKGLEVALQYDLDTLERLEANKDFTEFFERRN